MHDTDAKTQKIEPDPNFFMTKKKCAMTLTINTQQIRSLLR